MRAAGKSILAHVYEMGGCSAIVADAAAVWPARGSGKRPSQLSWLDFDHVQCGATLASKGGPYCQILHQSALNQEISGRGGCCPENWW